MAKLSIIIPTWNEEGYIENTLRCLPKDVEIIVVDNESADRTVEIARKYTDKVFVVKSTIGEAHKIGAELATGDIHVHLDADVTLNQDLLTEIVKILENHVGGICRVTMPYSSGLDIFYCHLLSIIVRLIYCCQKFLPPCPTMSCLYMRADAYRRTTGFWHECLLEDVDIIHKLSQVGTLGITRRYIYTSDRRIRRLGFIKFLFTGWKQALLYWVYGMVSLKQWKTTDGGDL